VRVGLEERIGEELPERTAVDVASVVGTVGGAVTRRVAGDG
jgi:hypothetical protein